MDGLENYPFLAGNIQELKQVVHHALILSNEKIIRIAHLRFGSFREPGTRPKIGLALGSGSVKGAAHVGVIKVLEEADIPIDLNKGLVDNHSMIKFVEKFIGPIHFEDLPIPLRNLLLISIKVSK